MQPSSPSVWMYVMVTFPQLSVALANVESTGQSSQAISTTSGAVSSGGVMS